MDSDTTSDLQQFKMYIGGSFVDAASGKWFESQDPYQGKAWAAIPDGDQEDIDQAVAAARAAFEGPWSELTGFDRARLMRRLADLIAENAAMLASVEVRDSGKLYREMIGQL